MEGKLNQLFEDYLNNQCSDEETIALLEYFKIDEQEPMLRELIMQELQRSGEPNIRIDRIEDRLDLAYANVRQHIDQHPVPVIRKVKLWRRIATIAAAAAIAVLGAYFFNYNSNKIITRQKNAYINDVAPGKVGATLTLANGKKINLADAHNGELANEAGISISKTAEGQVVYEVKGNDADPNKINTLTTAKGETYILILPDHSKVWLNAASKLTYASNFTMLKERKVQLDGEAYFQIAKDKKHPFVVKSNGQQVVVLGTHFNVSAYAGESIKTTLLEGSVRVMTEDHSVSVLKPGQQAELWNGDMRVKEVQTEDAVAWKNGFFLFSGDDLPAVMRQIARWYDLDVKYEGAVPKRTFEGKVYRNLKLSKVLEVLRYAQVNFRVEGRTITITP